MFEDLIAQGVYCVKCGCFTGVEPGHPVQCERCEGREKDDASGN